jgi:predicted DNA-binding protein
MEQESPDEGYLQTVQITRKQRERMEEIKKATGASYSYLMRESLDLILEKYERLEVAS